jgi:predicted metal-dependent hydrolase
MRKRMQSRATTKIGEARLMALASDDLDLRRGLDLFNQAHFFEAHEALEDAWRASALDGPLRRHLQGMVQLAVAFHHHSTGNFLGARSVLERGLRNLRGAEESLPSLAIEQLRDHLTLWQAFLAEAAANSEKQDGTFRGEQSRGTTELHTPPLPKIVCRKY